MSKAEQFKKQKEEQARESLAQVKMENSLLCQKNIELNQEVTDLLEHMDQLQTELNYYGGLDIKKVQ